MGNMFCEKSRNILMTFVVETRADVYTDSKKFIVRFGMLKVEHLFFGVVGKWLGN
jgi:hypothetical protein